MEEIERDIIKRFGVIPAFGLFGLDFRETKRMLRRVLKPHGLKLHVKTRREDDQSYVWIESVIPVSER